LLTLARQQEAAMFLGKTEHMLDNKLCILTSANNYPHICMILTAKDRAFSQYN